jgi:hypothetical protein
MKKLILLSSTFFATVSSFGQIQTIIPEDTSKFIGGLKKDCEETITMYLAPTGSTNSKIIDLKKYPKWDLTTEFLQTNWNTLVQGAQGSCTSFAVAFAISIQRNIDNWLLKRKRTLTQYSPSFIFNIAKSKYRDPFKTRCDEGISYIDAYLAVKENGLATIQKCPYKKTSDGCWDSYYPTQAAFADAKNMQIGNFQRPFIRKDVFKTLLVDTPFNPICIGVYLSSEYDNACDEKERKGRWINPGQSNGTRMHAMLIVGFDDTKNAFKVLDWRGKDYSDNGVIWMDYELIKNRDVVFDAYIVSHSTEYLDPKTGSTSRTGFASDKDTSSNISFWIKSGYFTIKENLSVSCSYTNSTTQKATFKIQNGITGELIKDDIFISAGGNTCFSYKQYTYKLTLVEVAKRGNKLNIKNPYAAVMRLERIDAVECK